MLQRLQNWWAVSPLQIIYPAILHYAGLIGLRTIHGSLAIEQNTLSLEQVTAVINGKPVLVLPKDTAEAKNAYEIYEHIDELDPYSVNDLLTAHGIMTRGLGEESGVFRSRPVGVVDQGDIFSTLVHCLSMRLV